MNAMVWDPADGVAIARCLAARFRDRDHRTTTDHPSACGWCDYPDDAITGLLEGFHRWAGHDPRSNTYAEHEVRRFYDLPRDEQRELVTAAQCLTGQAWPVVSGAPAQPEPPPSDDDEEEAPAWMA